MLFTSLLLAASASTLPSATQQDLSCLSIFAYTAGADTTSEADRPGLAAAIFYYIGRIEGRSPGLDIEPIMLERLNAPEFFGEFSAEAKRCGAEMEARGQALTEMGERIARQAAQQGGGVQKAE